MKRIIIYLVSIFLCCSCTTVTKTTSKSIVSYKNTDTLMSEFKVVENKIISKNKSQLFPATKGFFCTENMEHYFGRKKNYTAQIIIYYSLVPFGYILTGIDIALLPFQLIGNCFAKSKVEGYYYKANLSVDGRLVSRDNKPIKNKSVYIRYLDNYYEITTDDKGFIKETIKFNTSQYDNKKESSKQVDFCFGSNNPTEISYIYPFKEGTRYIKNKNSKIIKSKLKNKGKVIVIDTIK